jgi:ketosteroid isomerase-like protein
MSEKNLEVVRRCFELIGEGALRDDPGLAFDEALREGLIAADLEWNVGVRGGVGIAGVQDGVGREGWIEFLRGWSEDFDQFTIDAEELIDVGDDRVVAIVRNGGIGRTSGAPVEGRFGAVYTLKAGRITRGDVFLKPSDAFRAAGLSE